MSCVPGPLHTLHERLHAYMPMQIAAQPAAPMPYGPDAALCGPDAAQEAQPPPHIRDGNQGALHACMPACHGTLYVSQPACLPVDRCHGTLRAVQPSHANAQPSHANAQPPAAVSVRVMFRVWITWTTLPAAAFSLQQHAHCSHRSLHNHPCQETQAVPLSLSSGL